MLFINFIKDNVLVLTEIPISLFSKENEVIKVWLHFLSIIVLASRVSQSIVYWLDRKNLHRKLNVDAAINFDDNCKECLKILLANGKVRTEDYLLELNRGAS